MMLTAVEISMLPEYWAEAWDLLEPAAARNGLYTKASVFAALCRGELQLWVAEDDMLRMAAVTEIAAYPALKVGSVELLGGEDLEAALPFLAEIETWAKAHGCNRFVNRGRPGFMKKLQRCGYRLESVAMVKDFHDA